MIQKLLKREKFSSTSLEQTGVVNQLGSFGANYSAALISSQDTMHSYSYIAKVIAHELGHL